MKIKEIEKKEDWKNFTLRIKEKTFLQSWAWGEFNREMGCKIWRLGLEERGKLIAASLVLRIKAKRGTFLFLPHGPLILDDYNKEDVLKIFLKELKALAKEQGASFIRFATLFKRNQENRDIFKRLGCRKAPIHMHPELTWELNISPNQEEILMNMRKTTRYLIKKTAKDENIEIHKTKSLNDLNFFYDLYEKTAKRHNFTPFSKGYIEKQFKVFLENDLIMLFYGKYRGEVVVASIAVFWQGIAFYHHGASLTSKAPVSYGVQFKIMEEAKKRGCRLYNFWGIADVNPIPKNHPWWGLTLFKKGFGGEEKAYIKTQDYIISPFYWFNFLIEEFRKRKRRL